MRISVGVLKPIQPDQVAGSFNRVRGDTHAVAHRAGRCGSACPWRGSDSMDEIIMKIKAELGDRAELLRNVSLNCCQKYSGAKFKDIGERFGISDAAVSQASRRVAIKAETDQN